MKINNISEIRGTERKKIEESEQNIRDLLDTIKHTSMHIMEVPEGREKERENI